MNAMAFLLLLFGAAMLALNPDSQEGLEALATTAFAGSDFPAAVNYCENLIRVAPEHFESWFNLGVAQQKLSNFKRAAEAYEFAANVRPDSWEAHLNLGISRQKLGMSSVRAF